MRRWIPRMMAWLMVGLTLSSGCHGTGDTGRPAADGAGSRAGTAAEEVSGPTACVRTVPLRRGSIAETLVVYGAVIPAPGALRTTSIPFESQVLSIPVSQGQRVSQGDLLLRIQPSPDTQLQFEQAKNALALARQSYGQTERRFRLKLATNEQLLSAKQTLDEASRRLESMTARGMDGDGNIVSQVDGLVSNIYVQEGSIVPAGIPIMEVVAQDRFEVLLGVEPEDFERVRPGQEVSLTCVNARASAVKTGRIRQVSCAVNPTTRMVDVFVSLSSSEDLLLGEFIRGTIEVSVEEGLIVPRAALLPQTSGNILFTVRDGRAQERRVETGLENATEYQVLGEGLQVGEDVVVLGNYELADGMVVTTGSCK